MSFIKGIGRNKAILITGKPGVGKTTVGRLVGERLEKSVLLSIDSIRQLVVGGYVDPATHSWDEFKEQFHLSTDAIIAVANIFAKKGFTPIIEGVVLKENFKYWEKNLVDLKTRIFLLTSGERKIEGGESIPNTVPVQNMLKKIDQMAENFEKKNFKVISNLKIDKTVDEIIKHVCEDTI